MTSDTDENLGNWSGPPDQGQSDDEEDFCSFSSSDAEYFASASLQSLDDVAAAIKACKSNILQTTENTVSRKAMVNRLIQLQIRQEDLREKSAQAGSIYAQETRGHMFVDYSTSLKVAGLMDLQRGVYCQQCGGGIWVHVQSAKFCRDCGFSVHATCMDNIMRTCVAIKVRSQPDFLMEICPERMLAQLKYRCVECDKKFSHSDASLQPRLCDYTGLSFCPACHWNATAATPARIIHNWDFEPRPVSQATKQYLYLMYRKPVINIAEANPKLFAVVQELVEVAEHRANIMLMKKYLTVCRMASEEKLLLHLVSRQHFVDNPDLYSVQDLVDVRSGHLLAFLARVTATFGDHIRQCVLCKAKGFICEICKDGEVIFPFDNESAVCPECEGGFHRRCFKMAAECPRCERLKAKKAMKKAASADDGH